ncbi:MAG TPA: hypothetical protein VEG68_11705 [Terriglobales bacterium]|nr:hypothetical protein [Terriglobales bacterium]
MRKWLTEHRETVVPGLVVLVAILVLADLMKYRLLTASVLQSNKEALSALSSAVSIIAISVGAVFSYYRFFRGRTFYSRAELRIDVTVIATRVGINMHAVILEVKNIGTLSIWNPVPVIRVDEYGPNGVSQRFIESWSEAQSPKGEAGTLPVIDSGETAPFWTDIEVPDSVWAVFYTAFVHSEQGDIWKQVTCVQNTVTDKGDN